MTYYISEPERFMVIRDWTEDARPWAVVRISDGRVMRLHEASNTADLYCRILNRQAWDTYIKQLSS
jgi:hypothetical protein